MEVTIQPDVQAKVPPAAQISAENYTFLQSQIYRESGIVLDETKRYLIESRLLPIVKKERLNTLNDLCTLLRAVDANGLRRQVVEAMTTNETLFFRDVTAFDALRKTVLPQLIERRRNVKTLSFWSAAASSGQEAYSLAMMLLEMGLESWNIQILGTDLNSQILDRARTGRYMQIEVNRGLPARYLVKYFERVGLEWQLKDEVRRMVEFKTFDLRQSMRGMGPFDIVFCRNVLIYFDTETKKKILGEIHRILPDNGLLLLGAAETTINLDSRFVKRTFDQAMFYGV